MLDYQVLQNGLRVVYVSCALTETERNHAHVEKELLPIVLACEMFDKCVNRPL